MDPYPPAWALVLLGPALTLALLLPGDPEPPPEQLCGIDFMRVLVRVCGGPRWSSGARRSVARGELLKWLEGRHLLQGLMADGELMLAPGPQALPQASVHHQLRQRATANNPAHRCCLSCCTQQNLQALCPH